MIDLTGAIAPTSETTMLRLDVNGGLHEHRPSGTGRARRPPGLGKPDALDYRGRWPAWPGSCPAAASAARREPEHSALAANTHADRAARHRRPGPPRPRHAVAAPRAAATGCGCRSASAPDGRAVELDIKESAQGGMGPHGLVIGATGSGKSELLRTLVLGLAVTHSSEILNFVLVDFKGGATFARPRRPAARRRGHHQPRGRAAAGRPHARRAARRAGPPPGAAAVGRQLRLAARLRAGPRSTARRLAPMPTLFVVLRRVQRAAVGQAGVHRAVRA